MSAVDRFNALAAVAGRVRKRDLPAFTAKLDKASSAAFEEPGADVASLWADYLALDKYLPRHRAPIRTVSSLPPRVFRAMAGAYMREIERKVKEGLIE